MAGKFIMLDGIDGSGKSTVMDAWRDFLVRQGRSVCDVRAWSKERGSLPTLEDVREAEVLISAEPTHAWIGKAIREEIVKEGGDYSGMSISQSFALDREVLYRRLIVPALAAGKIVLQERGISTSVVYQPIQKKAVTLRRLVSLPGNAFALDHRPDMLLIMKMSPRQAMERIAGRFDKKDNSIFENLDFVTRAQKRFMSSSFRKLFEGYGTSVRYFPADLPLEEARREAENLLTHIFSV